MGLKCADVSDVQKRSAAAGKNKACFENKPKSVLIGPFPSLADRYQQHGGKHAKTEREEKTALSYCRGLQSTAAQEPRSRRCYLKYLKCVESIFLSFLLPSHQVSAFPSADCLKERGGHFIRKCRDTNGTPLYMPQLSRLPPHPPTSLNSLNHTPPAPLPCPCFASGSLHEAPRDFLPNDGTQKKRETSCFISLLTLYNVVNACFNPPLPFFCVHWDVLLRSAARRRVGLRQSSGRGLLEPR